MEEREVTWDGWGCGLGARGRGTGGEVSGGRSFGAQESREVVGSLGRAARATLAGAEPGEGPQEPGSLPAPRLLQSRQLPPPPGLSVHPLPALGCQLPARQVLQNLGIQNHLA